MNEEDNANNITAFYGLIKELELSENVKELPYSSSMKVFKLDCSDSDKLKRIIRFCGVKKISFFPRYSAIPGKMNSDLNFSAFETLPRPEPGVQYPIIGIIDSGIKRGHEFLEPWLYKREVYVPDAYQDNYHGTFVAGVIQYGHILNNFNQRQTNYRFLDIVALPNNNPVNGPVDSLSEDNFIEILNEVLEKYASEVKIWNLSLGTGTICPYDSISDIAITIDELQDKYGVDIFLAAGNYNSPPLRNWPPQQSIGETDRITIPADSVRSVTVGSIAHKKGGGCVDVLQPSPFSRRGPGGNYIVKPDVVDFGGNCSPTLDSSGCGIVSFHQDGHLVEDVGTSFSTPRTAGTYGDIKYSLNANGSHLAKALLIHSCRNPLSNKPISKDDAKYLGFGLPTPNLQEILFCDKSSITFVFDTEIQVGTFLSIENFPYPTSLFHNGKWHGEIRMSLVYNPPLDPNFGQEYCRTNIEASFGTYHRTIDKETGEVKMTFKGRVPPEVKWEEKYEQERVLNGFKWSPIKSYYRKISQGIDGEFWRLFAECTTRSGFSVKKQPFTLIITIKDTTGKSDIYTETINQLRERGFVYHDLQVQERIRNLYSS